MTDEPAEPLLEGENGERNLIVVERLAALRPNRVDSGGRDRIAGGGERELVDDDAAQGVPDHVHPLPEA